MTPRAAFLLVVLLAPGAAGGEEAAEAPPGTHLAELLGVLHAVRGSYVDPVDTAALMEGAREGLVGGLDPLCALVPADRADDFLASRERAVRRSGLLLLQERGVAYVAALVPDGPGARADVQIGDIVARVDGRETRLMPRWEVQTCCDRDPGARISLALIRHGDTLHVTLECAVVSFPPPALEEIEGVAVLRIAHVDGDTPARVRAMLARVSGDRLLVDLRGTATGDFPAAYATAALFGRGELGSLRGRGQVLRTFRGEEAPAWRGQITVLVDRNTTGPAEILASVLRRRAAARLVGERTFGLAARQVAVPLQDGAALVLSDAFYTGPDGKPRDEPLQADRRVPPWEDCLAAALEDARADR